MGPEIVFTGGSPDKPAVVFVHGLGMNRQIWTDPPEARMFGGLFKAGALLRGSKDTHTLYHDMARLGHTVITWSQHRPVGPIMEAVAELDTVMAHARRISPTGVVLVGHSRGGLIARRWVQDNPEQARQCVRALITMASPHSGSGMARWAELLRPMSTALEARMPVGRKVTMFKAIRSTLGFLRSRGVMEMLPGSKFLKDLAEGEMPGDIYCLSVGGTNPNIIKLWGRLAIPGSIVRLLPAAKVPEEMKPGHGDCLVTDQSARMPSATEHLSFNANHLKSMVMPELRAALAERIGRLNA